MPAHGGPPAADRADTAGAPAAEWLLTNGLGGSASGTVAGGPAHGRQGLLVAGAGARPVVLLLGLDERVAGAAASFRLAGGPSATAGVAGEARLEGFRRDPWPAWRWSAGDTVLERALFVPSGHDALAIVYRHLSGPPVHVTASPLCAARGLDEDPGVVAPPLGALRGIPGRVRIELAGGVPALTLWHDGAFLPARAQQTLVYAGGAAREEALVPGHAEGLVGPGRAFHLVFAAEDGLFKALAGERRLGDPPAHTLAGCIAALEQGERERLERWLRAALQGADFTARQAATVHGGGEPTPGAGPAATARSRDPLVDERDAVTRDLALAVRAGLARRGHRRTLLGTAPGGVERGEDALRAVTALVSLRGFGLAREVLDGYIEYLDEGLAPEAFDAPDGGPRYGDPAPSLWLVAAGDLYARRSADGAFLAGTLYPALDGVMQALRQGTRHGVRVDGDGLLAAGGVKRADLNALWYHALVAMAQLARTLSHRETAAFYLAWAHEHQQRFLEAFWDEAAGCLHEALGPAGPARGPSPAQALAVSLPPALLEPDRAARLVATLERELVTPWGLRGSPGSDVVSTAALGVFVPAWLHVHGRGRAAQERARGWVEAALCAGPVPERVPARLRVSADGRTVEAIGEPASALAAAELLRVWIEELEHAPLPAAATAFPSPGV
jgi:hypothetical protein